MHPNLDAWLACFERRAADPPLLPAGLEDRLSGEERRRIGRSLAVFQLGESSEGRMLLALARRHAARHGCPALVRITECFIREEQRHAQVLREFMADHGLALLPRSWADGAFRRLRRLAGFELALAVLITAELVGIQYYRALMNGTGSQRLRAICSRLLEDEALHVAYGSELLLALRARRALPLRSLAGTAHALLHAATALVVWCGHRRVLCAAGQSAAGFLRSCTRHHALYFADGGSPKRKTGGHPWPPVHTRA